MCMSEEKDLRVFLSVAKSVVGLLLFFGGVLLEALQYLYYVR